MTEDEALPIGWKWTSLKEIGIWRGGGTPSKAISEYWKNGTVHWVSPKDMKRLLIDSAQDQITCKAVKESAANLIPKDSVLMVTRSGILEHTFPVAVNTIEVAVNQDLKALTPHDGVSSTYLAYFLKAQGRAILNSCSKDGTTVSSIDSYRLGAYPLALAPTNEQGRIVSKIDELFSSIEEGERALDRVEKLVDRYRQSVLKAAVTGELTRAWREKNARRLDSSETLLTRILEARHEAWKKTKADNMEAKALKPEGTAWEIGYREPGEIVTDFLEELPHQWQKVRMDVIGEVQLGRQRAPRHHQGIFMRPYLRVANVFEERIDTRSVMSMNFTPEEFRTFQLKSGDILLNEGQSKELVGRPAIYRGEVQGACFTNTLVRFRATRAVLPAYALLVFLHYFKSGLFERIARITTNIAHLGAGRFAEMSFPVPSIAEQREILDRVAMHSSLYDHSISEITNRKQQVRSLRLAVLKSAFTGGLVSQDSADEPASVLLERIGAERIASPKHASAKLVRKKKAKA